jgi:cell division septation protein DedD
MSNHDAEPGLELVLDNRRLIGAFAVLIAICGIAFVLGFIEGKRQGKQEGAQTAAESLPEPKPDVLKGETDRPVDEGAKPAKRDSGDQPLDWYKNINRRQGEPEPIPAKAASASVPKSPAAAAAAKPVEKPRPQVNPEPVTYSVQVGAFLQKPELERRAEELRQKGFDGRMEPPQTPGQFYLLKVGKFRSRAEAVSMQLRLRKSGFPCFIKTNQ